MKNEVKNEVKRRPCKNDRAWAAYRRAPQEAELRNRLVEGYLPYVKSIARRLKANIAGRAELEDLIQAGVFGLIDAIEAFDTAREVKFETFSALRIRGAMIDELRKMDFMSRQQREKAKRFDSALARLFQQPGRPPDEAEMAAELGIEVTRLGEYARASLAAATFSLDAPPSFDRGGWNKPLAWRDVLTAAAGDPESDARRREFVRLASELLDRRERVLVRLYYFRGWSMQRISVFLGISESRISQIHDGIIFRLRSRLAWLEEELFQA